MAAIIWQEFANTHTLEQALLDTVSRQLKHNIHNHKQASLIVPGGRTPIAFFEQLSRITLNWSKVTISVSDERWVASDNTLSNEYTIKQSLLQHQASAANFISLYQPATDIQTAIPIIDQRLQTLASPVNLSILGMGEDGHTASLFANAAELSTALDIHNPARVIALHPAHTATARISMTLRQLLDTNTILLHITGHQKRAILEQALQTGTEQALPIRAVLRHSTHPISVYWSP